MSKLDKICEQFKTALARLEEALAQDKNEFIRDAAIQRFEFTFELAWKSVKIALEENHGVVCRSPKSCLREAYQQGLVEYEDEWIAIVDLRNQIAHSYDEKAAERIYSQLPEVAKAFNALLVALSPLD